MKDIIDIKLCPSALPLVSESVTLGICPIRVVRNWTYVKTLRHPQNRKYIEGIFQCPLVI